MSKYIHPTAVIDDRVIIGDNVYIGPNCTIGFPAEYKDSFGEHQDFTVVIKSGSKITGNVTIDAGTIKNTEIGSNSMIMKGCHIGHDVVIGEDVTMSPHCCIGGLVIIERGVNLGMGAIIHPRQRLGSYSMIGMSTVVTKRAIIKPGYIYVGSPSKEIGINQIGLDRSGIDQLKLQQLIRDFESNNEN